MAHTWAVTELRRSVSRSVSKFVGRSLGRSLSGVAIGAAIGAALVAVGPVTAVGAQVSSGALGRIGANQHFIGLVNGSTSMPVVETACPGPTHPGETGPVVGRQTLEVARTAGGPGFTGLFSQIYAWVVPSRGTTARPPEQTFLFYGRPKPFPSGVRVPCGGTGQVEFSSCPYLAPCAAGWVPTYVKVKFVNIAV